MGSRSWVTTSIRRASRAIRVFVQRSGLRQSAEHQHRRRSAIRRPRRSRTSSTGATARSDTIAVTFVSGTPVVVNAQTTVLSSNRVSGSAEVLTTGVVRGAAPVPGSARSAQSDGRDHDHGHAGRRQRRQRHGQRHGRQSGHRHAQRGDRHDAGSAAAGFHRDCHAAQELLDQPSGSIASFQSGDFRVASGFLGVTSERYLMLVVIAPDGTEIESHRISDEALYRPAGAVRHAAGRAVQGLSWFARKTIRKRLVIEVYVRRGRVIDPADDSEGTRDRPPTSEAADRGRAARGESVAGPHPRPGAV